MTTFKLNFEDPPPPRKVIIFKNIVSDSEEDDKNNNEKKIPLKKRKRSIVAENDLRRSVRVKTMPKHDYSKQLQSQGTPNTSQPSKHQKKHKKKLAPPPPKEPYVYHVIDDDDEQFDDTSLNEVKRTVANLTSDPYHELGRIILHTEMRAFNLFEHGFTVFSCEDMFEFDKFPFPFLSTHLYDRESDGMVNQSLKFWRASFNETLLKDDSKTITNRWVSVLGQDFKNEVLKKKVKLCILLLLFFIYVNKLQY